MQLFEYTIFYRHIAPLEQRGIVFRSIDFTPLQLVNLQMIVQTLVKLKHRPENVACNEMESGFEKETLESKLTSFTRKEKLKIVQTHAIYPQGKIKT